MLYILYIYTQYIYTIYTIYNIYTQYIYNMYMYIHYIYMFYCTLASGVHVQSMQDCCIGTYMATWFAASIPLSPISGISPHVISLQPPYPPLSFP